MNKFLLTLNVVIMLTGTARIDAMACGRRAIFHAARAVAGTPPRFSSNSISSDYAAKHRTGGRTTDIPYWQPIDTVTATGGMGLACCGLWGFEELDKEKSLHELAQKNNIDAVKKRFADYASDEERIEALNAFDDEKCTPMYYAIMHEHYEMAMLLKTFGADINQPMGNRYITILHFVTFANKPKHIPQLLALGADPNTTTSNHFTPLYWAVHFRDVAAIEQLLFAGADVHSLHNTRSGYTLLHDALIHPKLLALIPTRPNPADPQERVYSFDDLEEPMLHTADQESILASNYAVVELLLAAGMDANAETKENWVPLHFAIWFGDAAVVELLLKAGANPIYENGSGSRGRQSPLEIARFLRHKAQSPEEIERTQAILDVLMKPCSKSSRSSYSSAKHKCICDDTLRSICGCNNADCPNND